MDMYKAKERLEEWMYGNQGETEITPELLYCAYEAICRCIENEKSNIEL
jgi:hypothetical protein